MILPGIGASGVGAVVSSGSGSGGGVGGVTLTNHSIVNSRATAPRDCAFQLNTSGVAEKEKDGTVTTLETWLLAGVSSDYDAMAHVTSGALTGGSATDAWLNLGTTRSWETTDSIEDGVPVTADLTVSIRQAAAPFTVLATASISLYASAN